MKKILAIIITTITFTGCSTINNKPLEIIKTIDKTENVIMKCYIGTLLFIINPEREVAKKIDTNGKEFDVDLTLTSFKYEVKKDNSKTFKAYFNEDLDRVTIFYNLEVNDDLKRDKFVDGQFEATGHINGSGVLGDQIKASSKKCSIINGSSSAVNQ